VNVESLHSFIFVAMCLLAIAGSAGARSARSMLQEGNELYADGKYTQAIDKYDQALVEQPGAAEPKFNQADSYYRLDDLGKAIELYQDVAAESKDMALVAKAKYNLGNCLFQRGAKQRDSDLQKAVEDMKSSIVSWRQALDIDPANEKAARNIEVARLTIKDILDQIKKQQEQQKQQGQSDQQKEQQQKQDQQSQQGQQKQDQSKAGQDPNQAKAAQQKQDPNQVKQDDQKQQGQEQAKQQEQKVAAQDATAQEILDKEQRQKQQRQNLQRAQIQKVEKDW
jgi:Ca-activated chloride channel family protein